MAWDGSEQKVSIPPYVNPVNVPGTLTNAPSEIKGAVTGRPPERPDLATVRNRNTIGSTFSNTVRSSICGTKRYPVCCSFGNTIGSSICGAAAILAAEPVLGSKSHKSGIAVATVVIFGEAIPDPTELLGRLGGGFSVLLALLALVVATLSTNLAANVCNLHKQ